VLQGERTLEKKRVASALTDKEKCCRINWKGKESSSWGEKEMRSSILWANGISPNLLESARNELARTFRTRSSIKAILQKEEAFGQRVGCRGTTA